MTANVSFPLVSGLTGQRIYIEDIYPAVDAGRFPVKRIAGEPVEVWADIFRDGHAVLAAELLWRPEDADEMVARPACSSIRTTAGPAASRRRSRAATVYAIEAWTDVFATWRRDFLAKRDAGQDVDAGDAGRPADPCRR